MADTNDGSIVIDTELDNSGFDKGSDKLLKAVQDLTNAVDNLGDNMMRSFGKITPMLASIASSTSAVNAKIADAATQAAAANDVVTNSEQQITNVVQQTTQAVEQQTNAESRNVQVAEQVTQVVQQQSESLSTLANEAANTVISMSGLEREITALSSSMQAVSASAETGFASGKAVLAFDAKLLSMEEHLEQARARLEEFGKTRIPTEDYVWVQNAIQQTETRLDRLIDRQAKLQSLGVSENSKQWKQLAYDIELAEQMLQTYKQDMAGLEYSGKDFIMGSNTQEYARMKQELADTSNTLNRNKSLIDQEALAQARLNVQVAQERVLQARNGEARASALADLQTAQSRLNALADSMANTNTSLTPPSTSISGWDRFGQIIHGVAGNAVRLTGALVRVSFRTLANGIRTAAGRLRQFATRATQARSATNGLVKALTSLKTMLVARVKHLFISQIVNSVKEGINALAKFSDAFDNAISNISNRTKEIGANFSVSLGTLIQTLEPLVTRVLESLSTAITYFNAFLAMLGGKSTVTVAKKQTDSYAKSLDSASKSAEELKRQVYGFDELNKRSSNNNKSSSDSASDLFEEVPIEDILPNTLQGVFDKLKQDILDKNWPEVGKTIADGINAAVLTVDDWINNVLRPKGVEWAANIAQILNGITANIKWDLIGKAISDGLNTAFDITKTFLTTYDFEKLGEGIGTTIGKLFDPKDGVDWKLAGETIAAGANAIIDTLHGIVEKIPDTEIGAAMYNFFKGLTGDNGIEFEKASKTVATGLNKISTNINAFLRKMQENDEWTAAGQRIGANVQLMFSSINFDTIGENIGLGINGLVSLFTGIVDKINPQENGTKVANGVNSIFGTINWSSIAVTLTKGLNTAVNTFKALLSTIKWREVGASIGTFLTTIFTGDENGEGGIDWASLGELFSDGLKAILDTGTGLLTETDFTAVVDSIFDGLYVAFRDFDYEGFGGSLMTFLGTLGSKVIELIGAILVKDFEMNAQTVADLFYNLGWDGVGDFFKGIGEKLGEFLDWFDRLIDAMITDVQAFWSGKPSAAFVQFGQETIDGLFKGIKDAMTGIVSWIDDNIVSPIVDGVKSLFGIHSPSTVFQEIGNLLIKGLFDGISNAWSTITNFFDEKVKNLSDALKTGWENIKTAATTAWEGVRNGVYKKFDTLRTNLNSVKEDVTSKLKTGWETIKSNATTAWENIRAGVFRKFDTLKNNLTTTVSNIGTNISNGWNTITNGATNAWNNITSTVSNLWDGLKNTLSNNDFTYVGSNMVSGLQNGITSAWNNLSSWVSSAAEGLTSTLESVFGIASPSKVWARIGEYLDAGLVQGLNNEKKQVLSTVSGIAKGMNENLDVDAATLEISADGERAVSQLSLIADSLSNIVDCFRAISDFVDRIGGISIPLMAAGTEAPYKTRIATEAPGATLSMSDDLDETLEDQTYVLRQILAIVQRFKIKLSDADIQALAKAIHGLERNYGGA